MIKRIAVPTANVAKIKEKIEAENIPLYLLANKIGVSEQTLARIIQGKTRIGQKVLSKLSTYFRVNYNDFIITDSKPKNFYNHFTELNNLLILDRIESFSELKNNPAYKISRQHADSPNQLSHKIYNVDIKFNSIIAGIENFLKRFHKIDTVEGTVKTRDEDDIAAEMNFLKEKMNIEEPIKTLEQNNISVYYGHYTYRAIEYLIYTDPNSVNSLDKSEWDQYAYLRPVGKRIEVILFHKHDFLTGAAPNLKIYPQTGYREDELIDDYLKGYKEFFGDKIDEKRFKVLQEYIDYHSSTEWLLTEYEPEYPEVQDNPTQFLHPFFFIHENINSFVGSDKFKDMEKFKEASKEFKRTGTFFSSISDKFKFICNINPNSVPKYDGKIDAEITSAERQARYRHENEFQDEDEKRAEVYEKILENSEEEN